VHSEPTVMFMRPGRGRTLARPQRQRRWPRLQTLHGPERQFTFKDNALWRVEKARGDPPSRKLVAVTRAEIEAAQAAACISWRSTGSRW
jgi:hypothetical protein